MTMKKGEVAHFLFKPKYAYGDMGCPPLIPSSATVFYEVHVIDFLDSAKVDEFLALSPVRFVVVENWMTGGNCVVENVKCDFFCQA